MEFNYNKNEEIARNEGRRWLEGRMAKSGMGGAVYTKQKT
jgi:hypothetical protein